MSTPNGYLDGAPCWVDLVTPDLAGAKRFYTELFGWTFTESDPEMGHYAMALRDGRTVAGIAPVQPGQDMPPVWSVYLRSGDADAVAAKITAGGGKLLMPPMDIPGSGRMVYAFDPTGAAFGVWQPTGHTGAQVFGEPGGMCWHEVNTRDPAAADAFYRDLFGYEQTQLGDGDDFDYTVWKLDGREVCGRLKMTAEWEGIPPHWMTYFAVDDADASAARIRELGGKVMHGPFDSPHGRIAVVADPSGAAFSIVQMTHPS